MSLSKKLFLAILSTTLIVGSVLIWIPYKLQRDHVTESYLSRYSVFSRALARTIEQMERTTESLMYNAAKSIAQEELQRGKLSDVDLKALAVQLNVTHIFEIDSNGKFIRSTNEDPSLIPNVFSFCSEYRNFLGGTDALRSTPIIPPFPEPIPYKFLFVPDHSRKKMIEVGVRVDFLGRTLSKALGDDPNILEISLFAPNGTTLGRFGRGSASFGRTHVELPDALPATVIDGDRIRFLTRVESGQLHCCQCDTAKISKNGEYYYVLETEVSSKDLSTVLASNTKVFLLLQLVAILVAVVVSRFVSGRLSKKFELVAAKVRSVGNGSASERLRIKGTDEISILAQQFDDLLERLDESQKALIKAEKAEALTEVASQVAHDIRSPLAALSAIENDLSGLQDDQRVLVRNAVARIRDIANNLLAQYKSSKGSGEAEAREVVAIWAMIDSIVSEKRAQYRAKKSIELVAHYGSSAPAVYGNIHASDFKRMLSNLIDNSVEAISEQGSVAVVLQGDQRRVSIVVQDDGRGIEKKVLGSLASRGATYGKSCGSGLGLYHARRTVEAWGGSLSLESEENVGTSVSLSFPRACTPRWATTSIRVPTGASVVVIDDDPSVHHAWEKRLRSHLEIVGSKLTFIANPEEFDHWASTATDIHENQYFVDYEFAGYPAAGVDLIQKYGLRARSVLVTSRFEDALLRNVCAERGLMLLPKPLLGIVAIEGYPPDEEGPGLVFSSGRPRNLSQDRAPFR